MEIGGEGGAIDRIDAELVIVGHRERGQSRGFEQVAFDLALEHADFEVRFDADHDDRAERHEQRQAQSKRQGFAQFRPGGATLRRPGDARVPE